MFDLLKLQGFYSVYAGIGLPNEKSVGFHRAMDFTEVGIFKNVGYKMGNWHDTQWFQMELQPLKKEPIQPRSLLDLSLKKQIGIIIEKANN